MAKACQPVPVNILDGTRGDRGDTCPPCPPGEQGDTGPKGLPGHSGQYSYRMESGNAFISGRGCFFLDPNLVVTGPEPTIYTTRPFMFFFGSTAVGGLGNYIYELVNSHSWVNFNGKYRIASGTVPSGASDTTVTLRATDIYTGETADKIIRVTINDGVNGSGSTNARGTVTYPAWIDYMFIEKGKPFSYTTPAPVFKGFGRQTHPLQGANMTIQFATSTTSSSFGRNTRLDPSTWINVSQAGQRMTLSGTAPTQAQIDANAVDSRDISLEQDFRVFPVGGSATRDAFWVSIRVIDPISLEPAGPFMVQRRAGELVSLGADTFGAGLRGGESTTTAFRQVFVTKLPIVGSLESVCYKAGAVHFDDPEPEPGTYPFTVEALGNTISNTSIENMASREYEFIIPPRR